MQIMTRTYITLMPVTNEQVFLKQVMTILLCKVYVCKWNKYFWQVLTLLRRGFYKLFKISHLRNSVVIAFNGAPTSQCKLFNKVTCPIKSLQSCVYKHVVFAMEKHFIEDFLDSSVTYFTHADQYFRN